MLKVGLTGGIACGKSHVLREFHRLGVYTIDADSVAHRVILPGQQAYREIVECFGAEILAQDGAIDRKRLGSRVFADPEALGQLNRIVHPRVFEEENRRMEEMERQASPHSPIIMVDAALMFETGSYRRYDTVVVVYCHPRLQLSRLVDREGYTEEEAQQRIGSQLPLMEKVRRADYVIDNSGRLARTSEQVLQVFRELVCRYEDL